MNETKPEITGFPKFGKKSGFPKTGDFRKQMALIFRCQDSTFNSMVLLTTYKYFVVNLFEYAICNNKDDH